MLTPWNGESVVYLLLDLLANNVHTVTLSHHMPHSWEQLEVPPALHRKANAAAQTTPTSGKEAKYIALCWSFCSRLLHLLAIFTDDFYQAHDVVVQLLQFFRWNPPLCVVFATNLLYLVTSHE